MSICSHVLCRMFLETAKKDPNPLAAMFGGGGKAAAEESHRIFGLGGVLTHRFPSGGSLRSFAQLDTFGFSKFTALYAPTGTDRLRFAAQLASNRSGPKPQSDWGVSVVARGADYGATARLMNGPECGVSYHQRLVPGSPISIGGEVRACTHTYMHMHTAVCGWRGRSTAPDCTGL